MKNFWQPLPKSNQREMLGENPNIYRGGNSKFHDETLKDYGITALQSHRWQLEADIPEETADEQVTGYR